MSESVEIRSVGSAELRLETKHRTENLTDIDVRPSCHGWIDNSADGAGGGIQAALRTDYGTNLGSSARRWVTIT